MDEYQWDRFAGNLFSYITDGTSNLVKTNYKVDINMSLGDIQKELIEKSSIDELSPELMKIAKEYIEKHPIK